MMQHRHFSILKNVHAVTQHNYVEQAELIPGMNSYCKHKSVHH